MSRGYISRIETGAIRDVTVACTERYAEGLGISTREFIELFMNLEDEMLLDPFIASIVPLVRNLNSYNRKIVLEVLCDLHERKKR